MTITDVQIMEVTLVSNGPHQLTQHSCTEARSLQVIRGAHYLKKSCWKLLRRLQVQLIPGQSTV